MQSQIESIKVESCVAKGKPDYFWTIQCLEEVETFLNKVPTRIGKGVSL